MKAFYQAGFIIIISAMFVAIMFYSEDLHNGIKQKQELDSLKKVELKLQIKLLKQQLEHTGAQGF